MMWSVANGTTPWPDITSMDAAKRHCSSQRLPPVTGPMSNAGFSALMQRCWAHDPSERPPMAEVRDALRQLRGTGIRSTTTSAAANTRGGRERGEAGADEKEGGDSDAEGAYDEYDANVAAAGDLDPQRIGNEGAEAEADEEESDAEGGYDKFLPAGEKEETKGGGSDAEGAYDEYEANGNGEGGGSMQHAEESKGAPPGDDDSSNGSDDAYDEYGG